MSEPKQLTPLQAIKKDLQSMEGQFKAALPPHIKSERFIRVAMTAVSLNPRILEASRSSVFAELTKCAQDGLIPDGQEAAIVPYGNSVTYQPMVAGLYKKARNSGEIKTIGAEIVFENDSYESWVDENGSHFKHVKGRKDRGAAVLTYAYGITKDGGFYHVEIDEDDMDKIAACSKGKNTPWNGPFRNEMKKKSALKRLFKSLPSSSDISGLIDKVDDLYDFGNPEQTVVTEEPTRMKDLVTDQTPDTEQPPIIETQVQPVEPPAAEEVPI